MHFYFFRVISVMHSYTINQYCFIFSFVEINMFLEICLYIQCTCTIYKLNSFPLRRKLLNKIHTYSITSCLRSHHACVQRRAFSFRRNVVGVHIYSSVNNLTKVRILFTVKHRRSDNSLSLILFSDTYIDPSKGDFHLTIFRFQQTTSSYKYCTLCKHAT